MAGVVAGIIAFLVGLVAFFKRKATKAEKKAEVAVAGQESLNQAITRLNGMKTAGEIIAEKAAKAEAKADAKEAHDSALAEAAIVQVDAAQKKGAKAVSDLANERILAARSKK